MDSFTAADFLQRDWVKLTFIQVSHGAVPGLLSEGLGGFQSVFKVIPIE